MADNERIFVCLVYGDKISRAFEVKAKLTGVVRNLRETIHRSRPTWFAGLEAEDLILWRAQIPTNADIQPMDVPLSTQLIPAHDIPKAFEHLPPSLAEIQVIIECPDRPQVHAPVPSRTSPVLDSLSAKSSPTSPSDLGADLDKIANKFFSPESRNSEFLNEFVLGHHSLPLTTGSISGLPAVGKRGLERPLTAPSLLFVDLPAQSGTPHNEAERILKEFPGKCHLPLFGVSGCGKTRTAVDLLSRSWGFYFNTGAADCGSSDMSSLIQAVKDYRDTYLSVDRLNNTDRIQYLTYGLLYARLLILEHCLNIAGDKHTFSCQSWMLLQVATPAFEDVFLALFLPISNYLHNHFAPGLISVIMNIVQELFRDVYTRLCNRTPSPFLSKFVMVLDESQILGRLFPTKFLDGDLRTVRPALASVLFAFRRLADASAENNICVMPCGTGLNSYELTWSGGSASGGKLSKREYDESRLSDMVVDFAGWTDVASIASYLEILSKGLSNGARSRLAELVPLKAILELHRKFGGRFRPIVSTIEDIIEADDPLAWEECIKEREYRLTTPDILATNGEKLLLEGNLCGELRRMFDRVRDDEGSVAFAEFRNVESSLKVALATYVTQGGYMAFKGQLPKLVETAFGRIKISGGEFYTALDEPFALLAADNYFRFYDPNYRDFRRDQMARAPSEQARGKEWEFSIPFEMVHLFHNKTVPAQLYHNAAPPHSMLQRKATIVGWTGTMRTTSRREMTMSEFLAAHTGKNVERGGDPVAPFFFPKEHLSGPDIVFVVRFSGWAPDDATSPPEFSEIVCPVLVQAKLCATLSGPQMSHASSTVHSRKLKDHGVKLSEYCHPHGHYIGLIVSYPAEIAEYFMERTLEVDGKDLKRISLTIDDSNIDDLFSKTHVDDLKLIKKVGSEMIETAKEFKRRRTIEHSRMD